MTAAPTLAENATRAAAEIRDAVARIHPDAMAALIHELASARRIALFGAGREGLMMRALAMRLYHMGLSAHVVGDMSCPPVGKGDLLLVSAGPGSLSTVDALIGVARKSGARIACVTAQPQGSAPAPPTRSSPSPPRPWPTTKAPPPPASCQWAPCSRARNISPSNS